jgi:hypothetical protein
MDDMILLSSSKLLKVKVFPEAIPFSRPQREAFSVSGVRIVIMNVCLFLINGILFTILPENTDKKLTQT